MDDMVMEYFEDFNALSILLSLTSLINACKYIILQNFQFTKQFYKKFNLQIF